jgi:hypothetical protein
MQGWLKPGAPAPCGTASKPLLRGPAPQPFRPRPWDRPSGPRRKQLEGMPWRSASRLGRRPWRRGARRERRHQDRRLLALGPGGPGTGQKPGAQGRNQLQARPGQAKPQPLPPKATSLSRPEQEGMEAKTQGRKSQDGITRESELLNNFKGHHGPLAGANMGQSPSPQVLEPNHSKGLNRSRPGGP